MRRICLSVLAALVLSCCRMPQDSAATPSSGTAGAGTPAKGSPKIATFDSVDEGTTDARFTDGGITFYGQDRRITGEDVGVFTVDRADNTLIGMPGFTSPNVLGFGGFSDGPGLSFGRTGEFRFSTGDKAKYAQVELYVTQLSGTTVTLEALLHGKLVGTDSVTIVGTNVQHYTLKVTGKTFDELRLVGSGSVDLGVFFGAIDTVMISK